MSSALRPDVTRNGHPIPTCLWLPQSATRAVVLACHGGGGHKEAKGILAYVNSFLPMGIAVMSIDGPVHGERRTDGNLEPDVSKASFRQAWREGVGKTDIAKDFSAALDAVTKMPGLSGLPVGYIGVSMGTAYGIPLLALDKRVTAAVLGMWGLNYPASEHLLDFAKQVQSRIWFNQQWDDELFDRQGTAALFDAIGSLDKRLCAYPGPHEELSGERLDEAVRFLKNSLIPG